MHSLMLTLPVRLARLFIHHCRKVLTDPNTATHPAAIEAEFTKAWKRLEPSVGTWVDDLKPQITRGAKMDSYGSWGLRLEQFMGQRVVECLRHQLGRKAA